MGAFRIEIEAMGGHGDQRDVGDGEQVDIDKYDERSVDLVGFQAVEQLLLRGATITSAKLIHWPGEPGEVVDDLVTHERQGSF